MARSRGEAPDERIAEATGFLVGTPDPESGRLECFLVSALHTFSGVHPVTKKALNEEGRTADYVRVHFAVDVSVGIADHVRSYDLHASGENEFLIEPLYSRHPKHETVDIGVLPIGTVPQDLLNFPLDPTPERWPTLGDLGEHEPEQGKIRLPVRITDQLFILGFPFGDRGTWPAGIWTTAPIASEPLDSHDGLPCILVDSRSRKGQSGAPVLLYVRPGHPIWVNGDVYEHEKECHALVGVYSGRINEESDLGMVWTSDALLEVLAVAERSIRLCAHQ